MDGAAAGTGSLVVAEAEAMGTPSEAVRAAIGTSGDWPIERSDWMSGEFPIDPCIEGKEGDDLHRRSVRARLFEEGACLSAGSSESASAAELPSREGEVAPSADRSRREAGDRFGEREAPGGVKRMRGDGAAG